jgi:hypothetical protein
MCIELSKASLQAEKIKRAMAVRKPLKLELAGGFFVTFAVFSGS